MEEAVVQRSSEPSKAFQRSSLQIPSARPGWNLDTWLYLPTTGSAPYPVVVMANGFGLTKTLGLWSYAEAFSAAGYACIVFDYRRWGLSDGVPRNSLFISEQVGDYRTVVSFAKKDPTFDSDRIIIWGFSFSGGHILTLSAEFGHNIKAAIAQSPYLGRPIPFFFRITYFKMWFFALLDLAKQALGLSPVYIPITARPGEVGSITHSSALPGFYSLVRDPKDFVNKVSASSFLRVPTYQPIRTIHLIKCPILFVAPKDDALRPAQATIDAAALVPTSEVLHLSGGHFDMFSGGIDFERSVESQVEFLRKERSNCTLILGWKLLAPPRTRSPKLPPGPKGYPLIGNLLDIPTSFEWLVWAKWGEKWGDLICMSVFGTTIVVINSYTRAAEMLDRKSNIYSERPYVPMPMEVMEMKDSLGFLPYDKRFKSSRRLFHQELGTNSAIRVFFPQEEQLSRRFLKRMLKDPENFMDHCFQHAGAIILRVAYGYEVEESGANDPFVNIANTAMDNFNKAMTPGAFLVNQMPILLKVPEWFPGASWKRLGKAWAKDYWTMVDAPFEYVKKQLEEGTAENSFTAKWLKQGISAQEELDLKFTSSSMFGAGAETTAVTLHVFYFVMCMYPEIQKKAQAELDTVVGRDRLPTFDDRPHLPYLEAICKEVMRYHAAVPNVPHCTASGDIHDGMLIPKGAIVFVNIWNMTQDPNTYKNPQEFNPERFLGDKPEQDPRDIVFGFGRRICPGRLLGDASIYITLAMSLAAFNIAPLEDEQPLTLNNKPGLVSRLHPFRCKITPRMDVNKLTALIR